MQTTRNQNACGANRHIEQHTLTEAIAAYSQANTLQHAHTSRRGQVDKKAKETPRESDKSLCDKLSGNSTYT